MCLKSTLWQRNHWQKMRIRADRSMHTALSIVIHHRRTTHACIAKRPRLHYIHHALIHASSTDTGHATRNGNNTAEIFLFRQSDIGTDTGIVLMNGAKDCGLLRARRARGQRLDSVLFSQSDNRHRHVDSAKLIYSVIPATFHMLCIEVNHGRFLISLTF
jgi:hypothetical protein